MERIAYNLDVADRVRELPRGPWDDEHDKVQWPDPTTGLACLIKRNHMGAWCGYVGVDRTHPWYEKGYSDVEFKVEVHGGLTYAALCDGDEESGICHVPGPGEPEPLWWLGFDCAHAFDFVPGMPVLVGYECEDIYRDESYVTAEVTQLAAQIALAGEKG